MSGIALSVRGASDEKRYRHLGWVVSVCVFVLVIPTFAQLNTTGTLRVRLMCSDGSLWTTPAHVQLIPTDSAFSVADGYTSPDTSSIEFKGVRAGDYHVVVAGAGIEATDTGRFKFIGLDYTRILDVPVRREGEADSRAPKQTGKSENLAIPPDALRQFDKASESMAKKDWQKAIKPLNKAVAEYPKFAAAYNSLATVYTELGDKSAASAALNKAVAADEHYAPAYISLAELAINEHNLPEAETILKKAVAADPGNPQVWSLLANVELLNQHYSEAIADCQKVHSMSPNSHAAVHLIAAQAYEGENQSDEAVAELQTLLKEQPTGPLADKAQKEIALARGPHATPKPSPLAPAAPVALEVAMPETNAWAPPDIDRSVPETQATPACSIAEVLHGAGDKAQELIANLQQFSASEEIVHAELDKSGNLISTKAGNFKYVAEIREVPPQRLMVDEYRNSTLALDSFPSRLVTRGTAAFALIFHPDYVSDFTMTCEGLREVHGQRAWQVHFLQRPDRAGRFRNYYVAKTWYPVQLKGRAWIAVDTFQVLRMETDLVQPIKDIELQREHLIIEYGAVDFPKRQVQLWLPQGSDIYIDLRGHRYHDRHSFSNFELFWVETDQKDALGKLQSAAGDSGRSPESDATQTRKP